MKIDRIEDLWTLANLIAELGREAATPEVLARHTGWEAADIQEALDDYRAHQLIECRIKEQFNLWSAIFSANGADLSRIYHRLHYKSMLWLEQILEKGGTKEKLRAIEIIAKGDPLMERPVQKFEVTNRYSPDEIKKAQETVLKLKPHAHVEPPPN